MWGWQRVAPGYQPCEPSRSSLASPNSPRRRSNLVARLPVAVEAPMPRRPPNHFKPWTPAEVDILLRLMAEVVSHRGIARSRSNRGRCKRRVNAAKSARARRLALGTPTHAGRAPPRLGWSAMKPDPAVSHSDMEALLQWP